MPVVKFFGKVVPSNHYQTSLMNMPSLHFHAGDGGLEVDLTITVKNSELEVNCSMATYTNSSFQLLHKIAYDFARASINLVVFSTGLSFSVFFDKMIDENEQPSAFIIHHPALGNLCTAFSITQPQPNPALNESINIIMSEPALFLALDDLVTSASHHHLLIVNAARAIEGLRHAMTPTGNSREHEWEKFRNNLNMDRKYVSLITDHSKHGRHGDNTFIPGNITEQISTRSWTIFNRFIEFRRNNNVALNISAYPMLVG